jgi:hypothetical protein
MQTNNQKPFIAMPPKPIVPPRALLCIVYARTAPAYAVLPALSAG